MKASVDSGLALALNLNEFPLSNKKPLLGNKGLDSPCGNHKSRHKKRAHDDSSGIYSSKSHLSQSEDESSEDEEDHMAKGSPKVSKKHKAD